MLDLSNSQIGLIMLREFSLCREWETALIPDRKCIHLIKELGALPPGGWRPVALTFDVQSLGEGVYGEWLCTLRIFEHLGFRDTPFRLKISQVDTYEIDTESAGDPSPQQ